MNGLLAVLAMVLLAGCASPPWPAPRLAVVDGEGRIVVMESDGENAVPITEAGSRYRHPVWSPDGRRLAFVDEDGSALFMASAGGEWVREVYGSAAERPLAVGWSPDGDYLVFSSHSAVEGVRLLHLITTDTGEVRAVDAGPDLRWGWVGNDLLIEAGRRQTRLTTGGEIVDERYDDATLADVSTGDAAFVDVPAPNGQRVARFTPQADGSTILAFANPHTGLAAKEARVVVAPAYWALLAEIEFRQQGIRLWSADGRYLVVAEQAEGGPVLWIYPTAGNLPPRRLAPGVEASWHWR